jgi:hypothetical protein
LRKKYSIFIIEIKIFCRHMWGIATGLDTTEPNQKLCQFSATSTLMAGFLTLCIPTAASLGLPIFIIVRILTGMAQVIF